MTGVATYAVWATGLAMLIRSCGGGAPELVDQKQEQMEHEQEIVIDEPISEPEDQEEIKLSPIEKFEQDRSRLVKFDCDKALEVLSEVEDALIAKCADSPHDFCVIASDEWLGTRKLDPETIERFALKDYLKRGGEVEMYITHECLVLGD